MGGGTLILSYIDSGQFLGFKILNFIILGGFEGKNLLGL